MFTAEKSKTTPPLPGVRQSKIVLVLLLLAVVCNSYFALNSPVDVLLIPPLTALTFPLVVLLPYLWVPFFLVWRKNIQQTFWHSFINVVVTVLLCSSCWMIYTNTIFLRASITCFKVNATLNEDTIFVCDMEFPIGARTIEQTRRYERMGVLPLMRWTN